MWESVDLPSFYVSLGYILVTALGMRVARGVLLPLFHPQYHDLLLEFIATFELLATVFELGVIMETHGFHFYAAVMLVLFNYWGSTWKAATACPAPHLVDMFLGKVSFRSGLSKVLVELLAAALVYRVYVQPIWSLGYRGTHLQRVGLTRCSTHLQLPVLHGVLVEGVATLVFEICAKGFGDKRLSFLTLPLCLVTVVYAGLNLTGCYFNPILATTIQFGCGGITWMDHILVYWVGPVLGTLAFIPISNLMDKNSQPQKISESVDKKKKQ